MNFLDHPQRQKVPYVSCRIETDVVFLSLDFVRTGSYLLSFNSEKAREDITISIVNDTVIESTELLIVSLTNPQPPEAVLALGSATIIIINDDFRKSLYTTTIIIIISISLLQLTLGSNNHSIIHPRWTVVLMCVLMC